MWRTILSRSRTAAESDLDYFGFTATFLNTNLCSDHVLGTSPTAFGWQLFSGTRK